MLSIEHGTNGVGAFYADAASLHLISLIVEGKNNIYSENSMGQLYDVNRESSNNKSQCAGYLCKEQAENFAIALNKLSKDPELIRKYENKQAWSKKKDQSNEKALEALGDLLGVINLKSQNLEGACHGCINMAGRKDQLAMAKELKKFEKIDWVRERLRH